MDVPIRSDGLRNPPDGLLVPRHLPGDIVVRRTIEVPEVGHYKAGIGRVAHELLVLANSGELLHRAVQLDVAVQLAIRPEQDDVELLDPALLLHPSADADGLVEHFE